MGRKTTKVLFATDEEKKMINPENRILINDFLNYLETTDHSPNSIVVYKSNLELFFTYLLNFAKNKDFVDIKKRDIMNWQNYLIKKGLSPARIRVLKSTISSLGIFIESILDEEEKWESFRNIVNKIPAPNSGVVREKTILTDEQLENLLDKLVELGKIQIATFVAMSAYSGTRKSETILYKRSFFTEDTCKNGLYVTPKIRTKGKGVAGKLLNKYCLKSKVDKYLELWDIEREEKEINIDDLFVVKRGGEWICASISTVDGWMEICSKILGEPCYCHNFRHYFVSFLDRENVPISVIKDIIGHNDISMTQHYSDNPKEDAFMKYFSEDGIKQVESKGLEDIEQGNIKQNIRRR